MRSHIAAFLTPSLQKKLKLFISLPSIKAKCCFRENHTTTFCWDVAQGESLGPREVNRKF